jgi:hypothetical protein
MSDIEAYRQTLARLESDQTQADAISQERRTAIAAIRKLIEVASQGAGDRETPTSMATGWTGAEGIPKGLTMKDAAKWGLMKAGRPLRVRELYDLLVGAGFRYEKDYESFRGSMTPTLDRDRDAFEKVGPGLYYLAEPEKQKAPHTIQGQGLLANL